MIVEGNYVLMRDWHLEDLFDLRVFVDCDLETAIERLIKRHVASGICATPEEARERALNSDRLNALQILADGSRETRRFGGVLRHLTQAQGLTEVDAFASLRNLNVGKARSTQSLREHRSPIDLPVH